MSLAYSVLPTTVWVLLLLLAPGMIGVEREPIDAPMARKVMILSIIMAALTLGAGIQ